MANEGVVSAAAGERVGAGVTIERVVPVAASGVFKAGDAAGGGGGAASQVDRNVAGPDMARFGVAQQVGAAARVDRGHRGDAVPQIHKVVAAAEEHALDGIDRKLHAADRCVARDPHAAAARLAHPHRQAVGDGRHVEGVGVGGSDVEDQVIRAAGVGHVDEGVVVGPASEPVAAAAPADRVVAGVAGNRVVVITAIEVVVAGVASDGVCPSSAEDQVDARAADEDVGLGQAADRGRAGEAGGVERVCVRSAGEQGGLDRRHAMGQRAAQEREQGVGQLHVGVGHHDDRVEAGSAVVAVGGGSQRVLAVGSAAGGVDHEEHVVAVVAEGRVFTRPAHEHIVVVTTGERVVAGLAEEQVAATEASDRVGIIAAEDRVAGSTTREAVDARAALDPVRLGVAAEHGVVAILAEETVALLTALDLIIAAAAADRVVAADRDDIPGQARAVVAVEGVGVAAAAPVDGVVAVEEGLVGRLVAEADLNRLAALEGQGEVVAAGVGFQAAGLPREAAVGYAREGREPAKLNVATGRRGLDPVEISLRAQPDQVIASPRLQADEVFFRGLQASDDRRVGTEHLRVEQKQFLLARLIGCEGGGRGEAHEVDLVCCDHRRIANGIEGLASRVEQGATVAPAASDGVVSHDGAVAGDAQQEAVVEGVERKQRLVVWRGADLSHCPAGKVDGPEPGGAGSHHVACCSQTGKPGGFAARQGDVANFHKRGVELRRGGNAAGIDDGDCRLARGWVERGREQLAVAEHAAGRRLGPRIRWHLLHRVVAGGHVGEAEGGVFSSPHNPVAIEVDRPRDLRGHHRPEMVDEVHRLAAEERLANRLAHVGVAWVVLPDGALNRRGGGRRCAAAAAEERCPAGGSHLKLKHEVASGLAIARRVAGARGRRWRWVGPLAVERITSGRGHAAGVDGDSVAARLQQVLAIRLHNLVDDAGRSGRRGAHKPQLNRGGLLAVGIERPEGGAGGEGAEAGGSADLKGEQRVVGGCERIGLCGAVGHLAPARHGVGHAQQHRLHRRGGPRLEHEVRQPFVAAGNVNDC